MTKIGLGLYREQLTPDTFRLAEQAGAKHVVAHVTNPFGGRDPKIPGGDPRKDWSGRTAETLQTYREVSALVNALRAEGLEFTVP